MASNQTRLRKRDRYLSSRVHYSETRGHTTAGGGKDVFDSQVGHALSFQRREWVEDVNHAQHYTLKRSGPKQHVTLIGTMTRADRGSPLWVRRIERQWPRSSVGPFIKRDGVELPGQGNWAVTTWGLSQIAGGGESGYTTSTVMSAPSFPAVPSKGLINFGFYAPKGWKRFQPLNPKVSTTQFIGELRDLPRISFELFRLARFFRELGKAYLNYEFGWKPFVADLKSFLKLYLDWNERIDALVRDNGKPVRRKGAIFADSDSSSSYEVSAQGLDYNTPIAPTWVYVDKFGSGSNFNSTRTITTTMSQKYWFSGRFKYHLAPIGSVKYYEQIARIVFGVDLTPRVVYELLPWSWLLDWATNVGDVIANWTETLLDGLVAEYAYAMGHYRQTVETVNVGPLSTCSKSEIIEIKAREQATPYGFGLNAASFSGRQQAILAALLLART